MENESLPTENIKSPNDQSEIVDSYSANPNQIVYDLLHQSDFDINVTDAYFAKKVNAPNKPNEYTYLKLNQARLGDKIYLVVKCYGKPPKGSLVISIREIEKKGNEQNLYPQKSIPFLVNGVEKTELQFTIDEKIEYIQEIEIRPKDDEKYQELVDKLNSLENKSTHLTIRTEIKDTNATKVNFKGILTGEFDAVKGARYYDFLKEEFILKSVIKIITYHIYSDGKIEKHIPKFITKEHKDKYQYIYHDKNNIEHDLGAYLINKTQKYNGIKGEYINLIDLNIVNKEYSKDGLKYKFNIDSPRSYVNEKTLASFFGAMFEVNFEDISCNGFSHKDGSSKPSVSHINGFNGDFKYLRTDKKLMKGSGTSLHIDKEPELLDVERQNLWNNALYKFGWKSMLGWSYKKNGKKNYLNHITKDTKNHNHHLHVQSYSINIKEIKK
ncbi:hypothetical protein [Gilliamella sp. G0441]|uniref:hypothetical protein n=1 Tax=Gilliamella sp. G0441 TaxID=3384760 RepID=UPI003D343B19